MSFSSVISYKIVLLGDSGVGKSSIGLRYTRGEYSDFQESTIGASFLTKTFENNDGKKCRFEIWDTAGQERYHSLAPMYYRGAKGCVVVYDVTSSHSFEKAKSWVNELQQSCSPDMVISLVGNKSDRLYARDVNYEMAQEYARSQDLLFAEVSAKTGQGVNEVFDTLLTHLPEDIIQKPAVKPTTDIYSNVGVKKKCC